MPYKRKIPRVISRFNKAIDMGLLAAAQAGADYTKQQLPPRYFGGSLWNYKRTGKLINSIYVGAVFIDKLGRRAIRYGVDKSAKYALFWELGFWHRPSYYSEKLKRWVTIKKDVRLKATEHVNWKSKKKLRQSRDYRGRFREFDASARKYFRHPVFVPAFLRARPRMIRAFGRTVKRYLDTGR